MITPVKRRAATRAAGFELPVADRQVQQVRAPAGGDAPGHQQRLLRRLAAQGFEARIGKRALRLDLKQVPAVNSW
jgi:hypothetical protein